MINLVKYPVETRMLLLITSTGAMVLFCFFLIRAFEGNMTLASLDFIYFSGIVAGSWYIIVTGKTREASVFLMLLSYIVMIPVFYLFGPREMNWIYPIMVASFFMLKPVEALGLNMLALAICLPQFSLYWENSSFFYGVGPMVILNIICFMFAQKDWMQKKQLTELAAIDPLTGVGNRRALTENVDKVLMSHKRKQARSSLISFDIDHFKTINDSYGHLAGDRLLVAITEIICGRIRATDNLYRQGGEEFVIVAMDTSQDIAAKLAEELRMLIEQSNLHNEQGITISFGVAELGDGETQQDWLNRADAAMYHAKVSGRNTVCVA